MSKINNQKIDNIMNKKELWSAIAKYEYIITHLNQIDNIFKYTYCSLFKMTPHYFSNAPSDFKYDVFIKKYFRYLKLLYKKPNIPFNEVFKKVSSYSYRDELSFSSKMYHVVNPDFPIWDSVLAGKKHFAIEKAGDKLDQYENYKEQFDEFKNSLQGQRIIRKFTAKYPNHNISPTKIIDFVLWLDR